MNYRRSLPTSVLFVFLASVAHGAEGLREPGCRGADNPLPGAPCNGSDYCTEYWTIGSDDDDSSDSMVEIYGHDEESAECWDGSERCHLRRCGGPVSSEGGVFRFSGEFHRTEIDMRIAGRGPDFVWSRTYRSRTGPLSPMGQNWDHGYNLAVFPVEDGPSEAEQLLFTAQDQLAWSQPLDPGGDPAALRYCTLRSDDPANFAGATTVVLDPEEPDTQTTDPQTPAPGQLLSYVILPKNGTRAGSIGRSSDGTTRIGIDCGLTGPELLLTDGTGRRDTFTLSQPGRWIAPEFLTELTQNPDSSFTLTFPDTGRWNFHPAAGLPEDGKVSEIVDRNGNSLSFNYDPAGNLATVVDTLGRSIQIAYNVDGFIETVTDFTGRQVLYDYYSPGDPDGSLGDLKSVRSPIVSGTSTGNDFPAGKTRIYTYSTGFTQPELNHNLLTITDAKGQLWLQNFYSPTLDPLQIDFDRVTHQIFGDPGDRIDFVYVPLTPGPTNDFSEVRVIENDRVGNVTESFYDTENRAVRLRSLTGRAPDDDLPTGDSTNRPVNPLRTGDPAFFETRWTYNADGRATDVVFPNQSTLQRVFDELHPDRRSQANALSVCRTAGPLGGNQAQICRQFEYDTAGPTSAGTNFVTRAVDGRGHATRYSYDGTGNRMQISHRIPTIVENFEYNPFGQLTAYVHPDNGSGHRRRDELFYHAAGPQNGYLQQVIADFGNLNLTTTLEYDARGNVVRTIDPRGGDTLLEINQLDQLVSRSSREVQLGGGLRYATDFYYDANDNLVRIDVENRDEAGILEPNAFLTTIYDYDILDVRTRACAEDGNFTAPIPGSPEAPDCDALPQSDFVVYEHEYDGNRNLVLVRDGAAVSGSQPRNTVTNVYDERDLLFETTRAAGDPAQSTTRFDYDDNGNVKRVHEGVESAPRLTEAAYDGYDRLLQLTDPMGNESIYTYDANSNLTNIRVEGELDDQPGDAANVRLSETTFVYDFVDRRERVDTAHFDGDTQVPIGDGLSSAIIGWTDNSQLRFKTDDNSNTTNFTYDTANRLLQIDDAKTNRLEYEYDANSNVIRETSTEKSDLGTPDEVFVTTHDHDGLDRRVSSTDNASNTIERLYDSRDNLRVVLDAKNGGGSSGNETRMDYDGLDRLVGTVRVLTDDGTGGGTPVGMITTTQVWDDSGRLLEQFDDAGNATRYGYDPLNRRVLELHADGTQRTTDYDVHDNVVLQVDPNGTQLVPDYDLLDRVTQLDVTPGAGVGGTTVENFKYDGLSRIVRASDDDSLVLRSHDSLSSVIRETLDGQLGSSEYDGNGNRTRSVYPGSRTLDYEYDALNRLSSIREGQATIAQYQYVGPASRVERRLFGNGTETLFTYDGIANPAGDSGVKRIVRTEHIFGPIGTFDDREYLWDPAQNKIRHQDVTPGGPGTLHEYDYDSVYRMTRSTTSSPTLPAQSTVYALDGVGNRSSVTGGPDPGTYTLDPTAPFPADRQVNQYTQTPFDDREYDGNGNLTGQAAPAQPTVSHLYDYADRLIERDDGAGQITTYAYDALGRRVRRTVSSAIGSDETRYFYDGQRVCEEQDGVGATTATYVYGLYVDEVLQMERPVLGAFYFHTDDLYNTVAVTDAFGGVRERFEYRDYGEPLFFDGFGNPQATSSLEVPYLFTGRRFDYDSGFYWFRTRYLDPRAGRFTTRDSLGTWGDAANHGNGLTYVGNNPVTLLDPFGLAQDYNSSRSNRGAAAQDYNSSRSNRGAAAAQDYNSSRSNRGAAAAQDYNSSRSNRGAAAAQDYNSSRSNRGAAAAQDYNSSRSNRGAAAAQDYNSSRSNRGAAAAQDYNSSRSNRGAAAAQDYNSSRSNRGVAAAQDYNSSRSNRGAAAAQDYNSSRSNNSSRAASGYPTSGRLTSTYYSSRSYAYGIPRGTTTIRIHRNSIRLGLSNSGGGCSVPGARFPKVDCSDSADHKYKGHGGGDEDFRIKVVAKM